MKAQRKWKFIIIIAAVIILLIIAPFTAVGNFFGNLFDFDTKKELEDELATANEELAKYKTESSLSDQLKAENQRLTELLDIKNSYSTDWDMCAATVTGREIDNWYESITVDKGSADGITENMAVVNQDGLVGRTKNVTAHTSEVLLILDAQGSLGGMTQGSRIPGVLTGIGGGKGLLNMKNLPFNAEIQLNDIVVTSGEGGVFPAGLLVGTIVKVGNSADGLSKEAVVEPFCDFDSITEVLILIPNPDKDNDDNENSDSSSSSGSNNDGNDNTDDVDNNNNTTNNSDSSDDEAAGDSSSNVNNEDSSSDNNSEGDNTE
ncbi:MAG: rod shape-determining protein MreC [Bacillota bacterium]|nr:rod shape-determining protein MreC [Bacillota bacterium]